MQSRINVTSDQVSSGRAVTSTRNPWSTAAAAPQNRERPTRQIPERQTAYRQLRVEQDYWPGGPETHWFVAMDCSEIIGRNTLGDDVFRWTVDQSSLSRQYRDSWARARRTTGSPAVLHARRPGHGDRFSAGFAELPMAIYFGQVMRPMSFLRTRFVPGAESRAHESNRPASRLSRLVRSPAHRRARLATQAVRLARSLLAASSIKIRMN